MLSSSLKLIVVFLGPLTIMSFKSALDKYFTPVWYASAVAKSDMASGFLLNVATT